MNISEKLPSIFSQQVTLQIYDTPKKLQNSTQSGSTFVPT
jgi:hypothetical protein